jgi:hypothetical protein
MAVGNSHRIKQITGWFAKAPVSFYRALTWQNLKATANVAVSHVSKFGLIASFIVISVFVARDFTSDVVVIEPIAVPKAILESGYSPEVASRRLRDALGDYAIKADSRMQNSSITPRDELTNIVIPKIDISLDAIVSSVRSVLHFGNRRTISGELTLRRELAWLRLRLDGEEVFSSQIGLDRENPDELFIAAAPAVMGKIRPFLVASTVYDTDPAKAMELADDIIARLPADDINVEWSHILKGLFSIANYDYVEAEPTLRYSVRLNKANPVAHNALGLALFWQGKDDEAMAEFYRSIELDPKYSRPHNSLGMAFFRRGKIDDAIREYRLAIKLDPKSAPARLNLGVALNNQGKNDEALKECRLAVRLGPGYALSYSCLGDALRSQGKLDEANVEYRRAIDLDPIR